jgi:thioredoxin 1
MSEYRLLDEIKLSILMVVYFTLPDCKVCQNLKPDIEKLLKNYPKIIFRSVDLNQMPRLKGQLMVFSAPTILIFYQRKEIKRFNRYLSFQNFADLLDRISPFVISS